MKNATLMRRIRQVKAAKMAVMPDGEEWLGVLELPGLTLLWRGREAKWSDYGRLLVVASQVLVGKNSGSNDLIFRLQFLLSARLPTGARR